MAYGLAHCPPCDRLTHDRSASKRYRLRTSNKKEFPETGTPRDADLQIGLLICPGCRVMSGKYAPAA